MSRQPKHTKIIHRFWGGRDMPKQYQEYGRKWEELHPDWEVIDWDLGSALQGLRPDLQEVIEDLYRQDAGRYGIELYVQIADVIGYWLVYKYGGVYTNCVGGDTTAHTSEGVRQVSELAGRVVPTLTVDGEYRDAKWFSAGKQPTYLISLEDGTKYTATAEHRWYVKTSKTSKWVTTAELVGTSVPIAVANEVEVDHKEFRAGVQHGIVYGDGSYPSARYNTAHVHLFKEKADLKVWFDEWSIQTYDSRYPEGVVYAGKLPKEFKQLPPETSSFSYLRGFVAGLIATDGTVSTTQSVRVTQKDGVEQIRKLAQLAGIPSRGVTHTKAGANSFKPGSPSSYVNFSREAFVKDPSLLLRATHRERMGSEVVRSSAGIKVVSVVPTGRVEEVYCCSEPVTTTWVTGEGLVTGNCDIEPLKPIEDILPDKAWASYENNEDGRIVNAIIGAPKAYDDFWHALLNGLKVNYFNNPEEEMVLTTGPGYLTIKANEDRDSIHVFPVETFNPVHWSSVPKGGDASQFDYPEESYGVHHWGHKKLTSSGATRSNKVKTATQP